MLRRVVVVAGMHRGGTSALAASLGALGVEFGSVLMPATDDNGRGYWEDLEIKRLNVELLYRLGSAWYAPGTPSAARLLGRDIAPFRLRAIRLLRKRLASCGPFGIKDPRMSRLLPFWREAFAAAGATPSFLVALRDPLSVAKSLFKRDELEPQICYRLWLEHMAAADMDSRGFDRVVADFDLLVDDAEFQIRRIARLLSLRVDEERLSAFRDRFIDSKLVHSRFDERELQSAESVPIEVRATYTRLASLARSEMPDSEPVRGRSDLSDLRAESVSSGHGAAAASLGAQSAVLALQDQAVACLGALRGALHARVELLKASSGPVGLVLNRFARPLARVARRILGRNDFNDDVRRVSRPRTRTD